MACDTMTALLPRYLDDELDALSSLNVETHLETCTKCRQFLENQRTLRSALRAPALYYSASDHLRRDILNAVRKEEQSARVPAERWWRRYSILATCAVLLLLVWGFWRSRMLPSETDALTQEIIAGHVRSLMAAHLTDVPSSDRHTVKPWFNGRLDFAPSVEDLADEGFPLVGGRLDYIAERPVAALIYRRQKHHINLFIWPDTSSVNTGLTVQERRGYHVIHWVSSGITYWLVSDLNQKELEDFAQRYQARITQ